MRGVSKKGQVTIFIILAIVIVVIGVLIYAFIPQIRTSIRGESQSPEAFIQSCMEDTIEDAVYELSLQGGSLEPEHFYLYDGSELNYLCYTGEDYTLCQHQIPLLKRHVENEIKNEIEQDASDCLIALKENFKGKGYEVSLEEGSLVVELLPRRVVVTLNSEFSMSKSSTNSYDKFDIILDNNLYELVALSSSIAEKEASQGEVDILVYMMAYPEYKLEKLEQTDGSRVYIFTNKKTEEKFQFAVRSMVFPPGY